MGALPYYNVGYATVQKGSTTVVLSGGASTALFAVGDHFHASGSTERVATIVDSATFTLAEAWAGPDLAAAYYEIWYTPDGATISSVVRQALDNLSSGVLQTLAAGQSGTFANPAVPIGEYSTGFWANVAHGVQLVQNGVATTTWDALGNVTFVAALTALGITGASLALGGAVLGTNALAVTGTAAISGALSAGSVTTTGAVDAASAAISGAVDAASAAISGAVDAASAAISGALSAGASTLGATSATTLAIGGAVLGTNALAVTGTAAISGAASVASLAVGTSSPTATLDVYSASGDPFVIRRTAVWMKASLASGNIETWSATGLGMFADSGVTRTALLIGEAQPYLQLNAAALPASFPTILGVLTGGVGTLQLGNNGQNNIVGGATFGNGWLDFYTNNITVFPAAPDGILAMRLDAHGNMLVGETSAGTDAHHFSTSTSGAWIARLTQYSGGPFGISIFYSAADPNGSSNYFLQCTGAGTPRLIIYSNSGIANYQANNVNLSDERTKTAISAIANDNIMSDLWAAHRDVSWSRFKYKDQTHADFNWGYIAQDLQKAFGKVAPEIVDVWDKEKGHLGVYSEDLHNIGHAVLSEVQRRIECLEAEIATLKSERKVA